MYLRIAFFLLLVPLAWLSTGCASVQPPTAVVRGADLGDITGDGLTLKLDVMVSNPNAKALSIGRSSYGMSIADVRILQGETDTPVKLPANGWAPVTVPVVIRWDELFRVKEALVKTGGNVPYKIDGRLGIGSGLPLIGKSSIPIEYAGTLPLGDALTAPMVLLKSRALRDLAAKILMGLRQN